MNLFVVSKGAKLYSVLTQIILKAIFAILRDIILPFSKDAFFFSGSYISRRNMYKSLMSYHVQTR